MSAIRQPRSIKAATALLERFAELDGQIEQIETERQDAIAAINARADTAANDLIAERDKIAEKLEPWWGESAAELTEGKRKSIELGGCMIGSRTGRAKLTVEGAEKDVVAALGGLRWAKLFLRVKTSLDRTALLKAVDGKHRVALAELGIARGEGQETFFVERAEQGGTRGGQA